jgi:hypothetical protein
MEVDMAMDRSFLERNKAELARLRQLIARLTDADLARSVGGGWTVSAALAHLAFWDHRIVVTLGQWEREGVSPADVGDIVNEVALPLWLAVPPREAARLALTSAEAAARKIESAAPELLEAAQSRLNLERATHWGDHIQQIESALKA